MRTIEQRLQWNEDFDTALESIEPGTEDFEKLIAGLVKHHRLVYESYSEARQVLNKLATERHGVRFMELDTDAMLNIFRVGNWVAMGFDAGTIGSELDVKHEVFSCTFLGTDDPWFVEYDFLPELPR